MEHVAIPAGEIHVPHNWLYANAAARTAASIQDGTLIGRLALQADDGTYWRLDAIVPSTTWGQVTIAVTHDGAGGTAHAAATTSAAGFMSASDKTKLDGVATGATANATNAQLRDRTTHTGEQAISTVTALQTALDAKLPIASLAAGVLAVALTGLSTSSAAAITSSSTVLQGFGQLQAQVTALDAATVKLAGSYTDPAWVVSLAASKLTGTGLPASIVDSSLTSVGTLTSLAVAGNTTVGGTLGVTGASTLASLGVTNNATVGGTLGVTGASTLASAGIIGNATVGGTLGVSGASTLASLGVTGNATVGGTFAATGAATFSSTLAAGASTLASASITGAASVGTTLGVTGAATFASTVNKLTLTAPATGATLTLADNSTLATSGAHSLTLTTTGTTNVTLPTSGTLLTTTGTGSGLTAVNAITLLSSTWAAPAAIGSGTPAAGTFTALRATGNLIVDGDLQVSGTTIIFDTASVSVEDPLIKLATGNTGHAVDLGLYALYQPVATPLYAGLFFDATDSKWKAFSGLQTEPTTTVNTAGTGYTVASLVANIEGALTGNASTATALQTARAINGVDFDGTAAITVTAASNTLTGTALASNVVTANLNAITPTGGTLAITGAQTISTTLGVTGATTLSSTLSAGASTLASATITGAASVTGDFTVNTNKFTVAASSGNTAVAGTLAVTGVLTAGSGILSSSNVVVTGAITATGDFAIATNKFTVASASGNTVVAGTLGVTGAVSAAGGVLFTTTGASGGSSDYYVGRNVSGTILHSSGATTLQLTIGGATVAAITGSGLAVTGTLSAGASTLASATVTGAATVGTTLGVTGVATFSSAVTAPSVAVTGAGGQFLVNKRTDSSAAYIIYSNAGALQFYSVGTSADVLTLAAAGGATFAGAVAVTGDFAVNTNKFTVAASSGDTAVAGTLAVTGVAGIGNVTPAGSAILQVKVASGVNLGIRSHVDHTGAVCLNATIDNAGANVPMECRATDFAWSMGAGVKMTLNSSGHLAISNTVNVVSPTAPNRTVTMVVAGTTLYIAAKTTND